MRGRRLEGQCGRFSLRWRRYCLRAGNGASRADNSAGYGGASEQNEAAKRDGKSAPDRQAPGQHRQARRRDSEDRYRSHGWAMDQPLEPMGGAKQRAAIVGI